MSKYKTAIISWSSPSLYMDEDGSCHEEGDTEPNEFIGYEEKCPSCGGDGSILMHSEEGDYLDRCDYCAGHGILECQVCHEDAHFTTDEGWYCWQDTPVKYADAFRKENPNFTMADERAELGEIYEEDEAVD